MKLLHSAFLLVLITEVILERMRTLWIILLSAIKRKQSALKERATVGGSSAVCLGNWNASCSGLTGKSEMSFPASV